ncbi:hypothetical protein B0H14DRAFT_2337008 [Mycena olivaceomarginata]|nr:hypothetical protein B0H14DRAFT_2337008 [Mycena olivaceomarginata]
MADAVPEEPLELTVHDIISTRDLLLLSFPPGLVYIILDFAEYWAQLNSAREVDLQVHVAGVPATGSLGYLVAPPILDHEPEDVRLKVSRVEFTTVSHDQGWCSDLALKDTYRGFTWFEAAILRPGQAAAVNERSPGGSLPGLDAALGYDPVLEVAAPHGGTRWELQRNFCASEGYREHVISWDSNEGHTSLPADNTGAGDGAGFVACLAAGDRISVVARAMYPGWYNCVRSVQVSVYYGVA